MPARKSLSSRTSVTAPARLFRQEERGEASRGAKSDIASIHSRHLCHRQASPSRMGPLDAGCRPMDDQETDRIGEAWQCHTSRKPIWPEELVASKHKQVTSRGRAVRCRFRVDRHDGTTSVV